MSPRPLEPAGGLSAEAREENAGAQQDELVVLQSMFGEEGECELLGGADGGDGGEPVGVQLRVQAADKAGRERTLTLRAVMPPAYPSHLPPSVEVHGDGLVAAEASHVHDRLALLFFDEHVGSMVVPAWAEWLRDEWIAKQKE